MILAKDPRVKDPSAHLFVGLSVIFESRNLTRVEREEASFVKKIDTAGKGTLSISYLKGFDSKSET